MARPPPRGNSTLKQQLLFPPATTPAARRDTSGGASHAGNASDSDAAVSEETAVLRRLWRMYCGPLSQTHYRTLTFTDPIVAELWRLFYPLLQHAAVVPFAPLHARDYADDGGDVDGGSSSGAQNSAQSRSRPPQKAAGTGTATALGQAPPSSSCRSSVGERVGGADEDTDCDGLTASELPPLTHALVVHLLPSSSSSGAPAGATGGTHHATVAHPTGRESLPICTPEMHAALVEQPRIMLPLLEFLAAVMAWREHQQRHASKDTVTDDSVLPPLHAFSSLHTSAAAAARASFLPLRSRLYCCVIGDTAHPSSFGLLGAAQLGRLLTVRGTIVRMSPPRITCLTMHYRCGLCGAVKAQAAEDGLLVYPTTCEGRCRGYKWAPLVAQSVCEEVQVLKLQEVTDFHVELGSAEGDGGAGGVTKVVEVELRQPWLDQATVGDIVCVTGVLSTRRGDRKAGGTQQICIHARSVQPARQGSGSGSGGGSSSAGAARDSLLSAAASAVLSPLAAQQQQQQQQPLWTPEESARFYEMSRHPQWLTRLANSVAPALYGLQREKEAVLLAMVGGSAAAGKMGARSNMHLLLVGDPGMGKSQLLHAACSVAPRSSFVCAHTSSSCGLTMTLTRDPISGETAFEAGAVVHGDGGITCIDELDKAAAEHKALLEVMEQETVSIAKAGMVFSMPVHTSVLAAGNPVGGRFDCSKPITSNLNLSSALLSRFDIIICLRDSPQGRTRPQATGAYTADIGDYGGAESASDPFEASRLTGHVLDLHRRHTAGSDGLRRRPFSPDGEAAAQEKTAGRVAAGASGVLPHALVQDFIAFSRTQCQPTLSCEACDVLRQHYLRERGKRSSALGAAGSAVAVPANSGGATAQTLYHVSPRYLQALIRLAEARAKVELRLEVSRDDAEYAVALLQSCLGTFSGSDGAAASLLGGCVPTSGAARKKRGQQEQIVDLLREEIARNNGLNQLSHTTILDACEAVGCRNASAMLCQLNEFGVLLKAGSRYTLRGLK